MSVFQKISDWLKTFRKTQDPSSPSPEQDSPPAGEPAPAPPPAPAVPKWELGRKGEDVRAVQKKLIHLGHEMEGGADGIFGNATLREIEEFKDSADILEEGVGPETLRAIDKAYELLSIPPELVMDPGDSGPKVKEYQQKLIALGHDLPRFGADGSFGDESLVATKEFQVENPTKVGGEDAFRDQGVGPKTYQAVLSAVPPAPKPPAPPAPSGPITGQPPPGLIITKDLHPLKKGSGVRTLASIRGITLHQTATTLGEDPKRWYGVAAHIAITRAGKIIYNNDFTKIVWHGNGFNKYTIGIEIDGHYAGLEALNPATGEWVPDLSSYWRPASDPDRKPLSVTPAQVEACKQAIRWCKRLVAAAGGNCNTLVAHRQSSPSRISDPGQKIWNLIAVPLLEELAMGDGGKDFYILDSKGRPGKPLPEPWDPKRHLGIPYRITPKNTKGRPSKGP